jgi:hypothetical protein
MDRGRPLSTGGRAPDWAEHDAAQVRPSLAAKRAEALRAVPSKRVWAGYTPRRPPTCGPPVASLPLQTRRHEEGAQPPARDCGRVILGRATHLRGLVDRGTCQVLPWVLPRRFCWIRLPSLRL